MSEEKSAWTPDGMTDAEFIVKLLTTAVQLMKMLSWTRASTFAGQFGMSEAKFLEFVESLAEE